MHDFLTQWLVCPDCHGELTWQIKERVGAHIESGQARCADCGVEYPIRDGIGIFLLDTLPREDLWRAVDSVLITYLQENPELDKRLMDVPLGSLAPADQFFRAMVAEERGDFAGAAQAERSAMEGLYTAEYRACSDAQITYVVQKIAAADGPVVDLASGRCYLVERLAVITDRAIVATDFSLKVLQRNRRWLEHVGLYERVTLIAFDARRTPFRAGAVPLLTTYLGLPNIEQPGELLAELRRIVGGEFYAVSHFYPAEDEENGQALRQLGLQTLLHKQPTLERFSGSGWIVKAANSCHGLARPTPTGVVIEGAGIDGFPVAETTLEWCVIEGR